MDQLKNFKDIRRFQDNLKNDLQDMLEHVDGLGLVCALLPLVYHLFLYLEIFIRDQEECSESVSNKDVFDHIVELYEDGDV